MFINLQQPWKTTGGQHQVPFLFHDTGPQDPERMLVFATNECLQRLATSTEWYMDGNFKLAPRLFMQLYVIWAKLDKWRNFVCLRSALRKSRAKLPHDVYCNRSAVPQPGALSRSHIGEC